MEKDDWRLLNDVKSLHSCALEPTDGEELIKHKTKLVKCVFCWDKVRGDSQRWYLPLNKSCCICETCFQDFHEMFHWRLLDGWDIEW